MVAAVCISCKRSFDIGANPKKGKLVFCSHCDTELEVIRLKPPLLDWPIGQENFDLDLPFSRQNHAGRGGKKNSGKTVSIHCISCDEKITIHPPIELGDYVYCDECYAELEVVNLSPVKIDWPSDDYDYDESRGDMVDMYRD